MTWAGLVTGVSAPTTAGTLAQQGAGTAWTHGEDTAASGALEWPGWERGEAVGSSSCSHTSATAAGLTRNWSHPCSRVTPSRPAGLVHGCQQEGGSEDNYHRSSGVRSGAGDGREAPRVRWPGGLWVTAPVLAEIDPLSPALRGKSSPTSLPSDSVGKTSLLHQYVHKRFYEDYRTTLGASILTKVLAVDNTPLKLQVSGAGTARGARPGPMGTCPTMSCCPQMPIGVMRCGAHVMCLYPCPSLPYRSGTRGDRRDSGPWCRPFTKARTAACWPLT